MYGAEGRSRGGDNELKEDLGVNTAPVQLGARPRHLLLATAAAIAAFLAFGSAQAKAGPLVASAPNCSNQDVTQPFLPWLDPSEYIEARGGAFEDGAAGWSLSGGAGVGAGNESFYVRDADDAGSLALPNGSSATSATECVGLEHPTLRFFAKNSGSPLGTLRVKVNFEDALGNVHSLQIGVVGGAGGWEASAPMPVVANLLPLLPGEHTPVSFEFTPQGGNWTIDDVYVDPKRH